MATLAEAQREVDGNYEAFVEMLPQLVGSHRGRWALLHHGELTAVFDTARDAHLAGTKLYTDACFSVQEVIERPVDLGWFSRDRVLAASTTGRLVSYFALLFCLAGP